MTSALKHQFLSLCLLITACGSTQAQRQSCLNGFICVGSQQFKACDANRAANCPRTEEGQSICFGGDVGYGATGDDVGPCVPKPKCLKQGSFPLATPEDSYPEMCSAYFTCTPSNPGQFLASGNVCDAGLEFSSRTGKCEAVAVAGCSRKVPANISVAASTSAATTLTPELNKPGGGGGSQQQPPVTTTVEEELEEVDEMTTASFQKPTSRPQPGIRPPQQGGVQCGRNGRVADPESCRHFYNCRGAMGMRRASCPRGTYFNEQWRLCWFRVNCGNRAV